MRAPSAKAVELGLAGLFLRTSDARRERLREASTRVEVWEGLIEALERHGVLALVGRNLIRAGAELPAAVEERWSERIAALQEDARRFQLTLDTYVRALGRAGVEPTLLKGASLAIDQSLVLFTQPSADGQ